MTITVEDGSGVLNANSYVAVSDLRAYAAARGASLPTPDSGVEILLIKAMDYLESFRDSFKGIKTAPTQALQWPPRRSFHRRPRVPEQRHTKRAKKRANAACR